MSQKQERKKPRDSESELPKATPRVTKADVERARNEGFKEGLDKGRQEIIEFLEHLYLVDENRPDRGSPEAAAILDLVARAGDHFRGKVAPNPHLKKKGRKW